MRITENDTKFFINLSNDKNKIHFDKKYAKKFFFKEPIAHGINIINFALAEFIKTKNYKLIIQNLTINLKNFLVIGEDFELKIYKKKIIVKNQLNIKIEIDVEYLKTSKKVQKEIRTKKTSVLQYYEIKNLYNYSLLDELIFISYYVGSIKPGCGSLIHRININYSNKNNEKFSLIVKKKLNNIFNISYCNNFFKCEIITSKLKPFKVDQDECKLSTRALKNIKKKKILIFGSSSDIAKRLINKR